MGKVFTWPEVHGRRIPVTEDFMAAVDRLKEVLAREPSMLAALIFGSVPRGDSNFRSDIDCLVVYDTEQEHTAYGVMHQLSVEAYRRCVVVNFVPSDGKIIRTSMHHLGASFKVHLQASYNNGFIKGKPVDMIADSISVKEETESYMRVKMYNLQESWASYPVFSDERKASFLKKLLEAPMHVARKLLVHEGNLRGDSKRDVLAQFCETMPEPLATQLRNLVSIDMEYTKELGAQLKKSDLLSYDDFLRYLEEQVPSYLSFMRGVLLYVAKAAR